MQDMVNSPPHYIGNGLEVIEVIEGWKLGFHLGNAVKYVLRAGRKGDGLEDLRKALWYLTRAQERQADGHPLLTGEPASFAGVLPTIGEVQKAFPSIEVELLGAVAQIRQCAVVPSDGQGSAIARALWAVQNVIDVREVCA